MVSHDMQLCNSRECCLPPCIQNDRLTPFRDIEIDGDTCPVVVAKLHLATLEPSPSTILPAPDQGSDPHMTWFSRPIIRPVAERNVPSHFFDEPCLLLMSAPPWKTCFLLPHLPFCSPSTFAAHVRLLLDIYACQHGFPIGILSSL